MPSKMTNKLLIERLNKINQEIVGEFKDSRTPITIRCKKCGFEREKTSYKYK